MKCDELKPLKNLECSYNTSSKQDQVIAEDSEGNCYGFDSWEEVYLKDEVDAAIAELKAENERLKRCEIWMKQHFFCEEVIACESAKNRKLKRALWLARAEWARSSALSYHLIESHPNKDVAETYKRKANKWEKAKDKCLKKAEEYK